MSALSGFHPELKTDLAAVRTDPRVIELANALSVLSVESNTAGDAPASAIESE
jgi:hypothetical protein